MSLTYRELQEKLDKMVDSDDDSYNRIDLDLICPSDLEELLQQIDSNIEFDDNIETNGWSGDFWISFEYKEISLC